MSRRAKILLVCLFITLLSIPLGYVWVAWRPVDPLSFHIVGKQEVKEEKTIFNMNPGSVWNCEVDVRNASATTIRLISANVRWSGPQGLVKDIGALDIGPDPFGAPGEDRILRLPAHGTVRTRMTVNDDRTVENTEVHYQWISSIREDASELMNTLKKRLRLSASGHPFDYSSNPFDQGITPLHWSNTVPRRRRTQPNPASQTPSR